MGCPSRVIQSQSYSLIITGHVEFSLAIVQVRLAGCPFQLAEVEKLLARPALDEAIGVRFAAIGQTLRLAPAVLPGPIRLVQPPDRANRLARLVRDTLVLPVPNHHAGMVPSLPHPLRVLRDDLRRHGVLVQLAPKPDGKLVLNQEAFLVGDVVPEFRRETDAIAERSSSASGGTSGAAAAPSRFATASRRAKRPRRSGTTQTLLPRIK